MPKVGIPNSDSEQRTEGLRSPYRAESTAHPGTRGWTGTGSEGPSEDGQTLARGQGFEGVHLLPPVWPGDGPLPGTGGRFKMPGSWPGICWDFAFCLPGPPTQHATSCSLAEAWSSPGTASVPGMIWDKDTHVRLSSRGTRHPLACTDRNPGRRRGGGAPRYPGSRGGLERKIPQPVFRARTSSHPVSPLCHKAQVTLRRMEAELLFLLAKGEN